MARETAVPVGANGQGRGIEHDDPVVGATRPPSTTSTLPWPALDVGGRGHAANANATVLGCVSTTSALPSVAVVGPGASGAATAAAAATFARPHMG